MTVYAANLDFQLFNQIFGVNDSKNENKKSQIYVIENQENNEKLCISFSDGIDFKLNNGKRYNVLVTDSDKLESIPAKIASDENNYYIHNKKDYSLVEIIPVSKEEMYNWDVIKKENIVLKGYEVIILSEVENVTKIKLFNFNSYNFVNWFHHSTFSYSNGLIKAQLNKVSSTLRRKLFKDNFPIDYDNYKLFLNRFFENIFSHFYKDSFYDFKDKFFHISCYFEEDLGYSFFKSPNIIKHLNLKSESDLIAEIKEEDIELEEINGNYFLISNNFETIYRFCSLYNEKLSEYGQELLHNYADFYSERFINILEREKILSNFVIDTLASIANTCDYYKKDFEHETPSSHKEVIEAYSGENYSLGYYNILQNREFFTEIVKEIQQ